MHFKCSVRFSNAFCCAFVVEGARVTRVEAADVQRFLHVALLEGEGDVLVELSEQAACHRAHAVSSSEVTAGSSSTDAPEDGGREAENLGINKVHAKTSKGGGPPWCVHLEPNLVAENVEL